MPIQDNLNGALLISAIDFILSFVIIGGIGLLLALFPLLKRFDKKAGTSYQVLSPKQQIRKDPSPACVSQSLFRSTQPAAGGIHPGLSDQQLLALLTAAAFEVLGATVRVDRFRPLVAKDWNWAAQGRHILQSHKLK